MKRKVELGNEKFVVMHWDTFDNETFKVGGANTLIEALAIINKKYKGCLSDEGADRIEIINLKGDIVYKVGVK